jgi:hypothetical protein
MYELEQRRLSWEAAMPLNLQAISTQALRLRGRHVSHITERASDLGDNLGSSGRKAPVLGSEAVTSGSRRLMKQKELADNIL